MASLVMCVGEGKGTWSSVAQVLREIPWDKVVIVTTSFFREQLALEKEALFVIVDSQAELPVMVEHIRKELDGTLFGDVAVNFVSGTGKEHMAILAALLKIGVGIRLFAATKEGCKEI